MTDIEKAIQILKDDGVVGIPTETVYGLAADITRPKGIERIFKTKERPFFDPLIVHISHEDQLKNLTQSWTETHQRLAQAFWPGPLTFILDKTELVSDLITSGLSTVGVRMPNHPITLELIQKLGHPVAAPSANKFKKISPTSAEHVQEEFPDVLVLDGGLCQIGIESTILEVKSDEIIIYRPGMITPKMISNLLGEDTKVSFKESQVAPGHLKHHYMPKKPIIFNVVDSSEDGDIIPDKILTSINTWELPSNPSLAARELYAKFRELDKANGNAIQIDLFQYQINNEEFKGVINRLIKASSYFLPKKFSNKS